MYKFPIIISQNVLLNRCRKKVFHHLYAKTAENVRNPSIIQCIYI